ncbi:MAG TPA: MDR family MFS transporter [Longimicrobiales bacterium]|nr:MDR family MFS transporter [Longimicrobiales bacterium]
MSSNAVSMPGAPLPRRQVLVIFSGLLLAMLLAALDSTIVATALPTIVGELGGLDRLGWVVTAYLLAQTVVTPLYGKLGDLYGRKVVLQSAVVLFLLGSVLCGMANSMMQLILFRAIQGLGGGGLMVTSQAVVGDIVPPRERGRYQGIFGAVFGLSSIAGPLLGGYFTTHLSWRWIFYINLPLGLVALLVIAAVLPRRTVRVQHAIDYLGAGLLALALSALVLFTDLGGITLPWTSTPMLALIGSGLLLLGAFVFVEKRAREPVLPLRLFRDRTFTLTSGIGLIVGFAMFGSVTYIPLFLQVVNGATPTGSGLQMLPMMGGMLLTSISSGQLISRWGRYRAFPIAGTAIMALGLFLLSRMSADTSVLTASIYMAVLGSGMGFVMQVLVIAVQNTAPYADLGVATSGATLFRLIGGSLGTAVFGAIFAGELAMHLSGAGGATLPAGTGVSPQVIAELAPADRLVYITSFTTSLGTVFEFATGVALVGFLLTWFVPEKPLRETVGALAEDIGQGTGEIFPMPVDARSVRQLEQSLSLIAWRDTRREYIRQVVNRAGIDLSPAAAWLLVQLDEKPGVRVLDHAHSDAERERRVRAAFEELRERGLLEPGASLDDGAVPNDAGCALLDRLVAARREHLQETIRDWDPARRADVAAAIARVSREMVPARATRP